MENDTSPSDLIYGGKPEQPEPEPDEKRRSAGIFHNALRKLMYGTWGEVPEDKYHKVRYQRLWISAVLVTAAVSFTPLIVMTFVNISQYKKTLKEEITHPIQRLAAVNKRSFEFALTERKYALEYIISDKTFEELNNRENLRKILSDLKASFGGFIDLGLIDDSGKLLSYVGPFNLEGVNYSSQEWFSQMVVKGSYVSDVFLGYRDLPHFVIAVKHEDEEGYYILRATIDTDLLSRQAQFHEKGRRIESFLVNRKGRLQVSSSGMKVLDQLYVPVPPYSPDPEVLEWKDEEGTTHIVGYSYIENTPFVFMIIGRAPALMSNWFRLRTWLIGFLVGSIFIMLILNMGISSVLVSRIRDADRRHDKAIHKVEYASKMASIGRLAAGVAHEINNPLAIINEKAGLLKDMVEISEDFPRKDKSVQLVDSIIASVDRCSTITHRLLGFARHMDVSPEKIDIEVMVKEVLGFLEKEAQYRDIEIQTFFDENLPMIDSDKGQLQQVLLNLVNNAFEAMDKGGRVGILAEQKGPNTVDIVISDNGPGIPKADIDNIFEPFFTTKREGTGLGLSITYGIVKKLKGDIKVDSSPERGTSFTITLPVRRTE